MELDYPILLLLLGACFSIVMVVGSAFGRQSRRRQALDSIVQFPADFQDGSRPADSNQTSRTIIDYTESDISKLRKSARRGLGQHSSSGFMSVIAASIAILGFVFANNISLDNKGLFWPFYSPFILLSSFLGWWARREFEATRKQRQKEMDTMGGEYVLYFRPFDFDLKSEISTHVSRGGVFSKRITSVPFEEILGQICAEQNLGLRSIGYVSGQFGPSAMAVSDDNWQELAVELMQGAALIVVIPGASPGSFWEIEQISKSPAAAKTLWIMPPRSKLRQADLFVKNWDRLCKECQQKLRIPFPRYHTFGAIFAYASRNGVGLEVKMFDMRAIEYAVMNRRTPHTSFAEVATESN